jgi:hypothetical protein
MPQPPVRTKPKEIKRTKQANSSENFADKILRYSAVASSPLRGDNFDADKAIAESADSQKALGAKSSLEAMLIAQMTAVHILQQTTVSLANSTAFSDVKQHYTNSAVKLSNCFIQQAALLAKLQGLGGQKIVVEHVEVHQGGQAVVGNISGVIPDSKEKI